ncbi:MAG: hypothetical protein ABI333_27695 [bacterium]
MTTILIALLSSGFVGQPPRAAPAKSTPAVRRTVAERKSAAGRAYAKGQKLYEKRRYRAAIQALRQALDHWPYREIHFNIALCYYELREPVGAVRHLRLFLEGASPKERRSVPGALRRMQRRVGVLVVRASDTQTEIWVQGRLRGRGRVEQIVRPGEIAVELKQGKETLAHKLLRVPRGGTATWDYSLGRVITKLETKPPRRRVRLHWGYFVGAAGTAVAAAAAAVGLGYKTRALHREFDLNPSWPTRDEGLRYQTLTNVMWGVAGAAFVSAAVIAIFTRWRRKERPDRVQVLPVLTPGGVGVTGTF